MYVFSTNGLRGREEPSTDSSVLKTFLHGQRLIVLERDTPITIDGISDYWCKTYFIDFLWVFGGYLSENFPLDAPAFLGRWHSNGICGFACESVPTYNFTPDDNRYWKTNYQILQYGKWSLDGNTITLKYSLPIEDSMEWGPDDQIDRVQLIIKNPNNINLIYQDGNTVELVRCSAPYGRF
jgi:hypothetical protein